MADQITICNLALSEVGTRSTIASLSEGSAEANTLSLHWDSAVEVLLQKARWNFARQQASLTLLADATQGQAVPVPWLYKYAYPSDCVQGRFVMPSTLVTNPGTTPGVPTAPTAVMPPVRFLVAADVDASGNKSVVILTNQPQAIFVYTGRITNPALFDGQFSDALATYLGARVCMALTGDRAKTDDMLAKANALLKDAAASSGNEGLTIIDNVPDWMRVRGYAADYAYPDGGMYTWGAPALTLIQ